ncbi:MAG: MFS transporter [Oceanipulchritudo sp.]
MSPKEEFERSGRRRSLSPPLALLSGFWEKSGALMWPRNRRGEGYGSILKGQPWTVVFCFGFVFASGFGQTFFLSLFQNGWQEDLGISAGQMGSVYGLATLVSGLLLPWGGRWLDHTPPRRAALMVLLGLSLFTLLVASILNIWMLGICLFGLRFFGQGMSASLGVTYAARWFERNRGRAVSLSSLGYPLSEAVMPLTATLALATLGWRWTWVGSALVIGAVLIPLALLSLKHRYRKGESETVPDDSEGGPDKPNPPPAARPLWLDWRFYLMLGVVSPIPFVGTGVIFFQATLAESRGWSLAVFPSGFFLFAVVRALFSLSAGAWVDRIGPMRLMGFPGLAFALAITFLLHPAAVMVIPFFIFMGVSFGASGAVMTATFTEIFGKDRIGAVRGASSSVAVFVTAAAPAIFGWVLDSGATLEHLLTGCVFLLLILAWGSSLLLRWLFRL